MRLLAAVFTVVLLGTAVFAGYGLWEEVTSPPRTGQINTRPDKSTEEQQPPSSRPALSWPALFGEPQPPTVPAATPPTEEKQPPKPPKPPLSSLGYTLNGVVKTEDGVWAMVGHPAGGRLLRIGDELEPDVIVSRIDKDGLWVSRDGDEPELLAFPQDAESRL